MSKEKQREGVKVGLSGVLVGLLLVGCASKPTTNNDAPSMNGEVRVTCQKVVQPEDQVQLEMIDALMSRQRDYAALARLEDRPMQTVEHWLRYGQLQASVGDLDKAEEVFQSLVDKCGTGRSYHGLGMVMLKREHVLKALDNLKVARDKAPASSQVRNDYGYVLMLIGRYDDAAYELRTAMELANGEGPVRQNLAMALMLTDDESGLRWMERNFDFSAEELAHARNLSRGFVR